MVLAEYTAQRAVAEKYRTCPVGAGETGLFPFMERGKANADGIICPAEAQLPAGSIDAAVSWA